jgi:hypothetical protein
MHFNEHSLKLDILSECAFFFQLNNFIFQYKFFLKLFLIGFSLENNKLIRKRLPVILMSL